MIAVLSGTLEGREIASLLISKGFEVLLVAPVDGGCRFTVQNVLTGMVREHAGQGALELILKTYPFGLMVDTSHPFSEQISSQAKQFCHQRNIPYIRFVRKEVVLPESPLLFPVYSWSEAAEKAASLGETIFLTTGSYQLEQMIKHPKMSGKRVVVRVLPDHRVIAKVQSLGIACRDIVAMQGPFSREMNRATFKMYNASVVVTKDSGRAGGTDTKISAALGLNIPAVVIKRAESTEPDGFVASTYKQVLDKIADLVRLPKK